MKLWDYEKNAEEGIYPENLKPHSDTKTWWKCEKGHSWQTQTKHLTRGKRCPICSSRKLMPGVNDLATFNPELAKEWHPYKNKDLKPSDVMPHCIKKVWWRGKCGHEWRADVDHRTNGRGCPICLGMKALTVDRSIFEMVPEIVNDWDKEKNGDLHPRNVSWRSGKNIWWKCDKGHSYRKKPINKIYADPDTGEIRVYPCPICAGTIIVKGINDFATIYPDIAEQWDTEKNGEIDALSRSSKKKVWWICDKGHSWQTAVAVRTRGAGCPYCAGKEVLTGYNDLETLNPELAEELHPTKNNGVLASQIALNSTKKVWWLGRCGHEWEADPHHRNRGTGGPYCAGKEVLIGYNDLETLNPELAEELHPTKNNGVLASQIALNSKKKVWWLGRCGHDWEARIQHRNRGSGCPYCAGKLPILGETDLATIMPEIAEEWNYDKNRGKTPQMFSCFSNKKAWWRCEEGHEWRAEIASRTRLGHGCPICAKNRR